MKPNPDAPRGPSVRLTEDILKNLGLTCIWLEPAGADQTHLSVCDIAARKAQGTRIWFRNERDAKRVEQLILSRCQQSKRIKTWLSVALPAAQVAQLVEATADSLGLTPILDCDVATTFDSLHRRIEAALSRMQRDGSMKQINREYASLRRASEKTPQISDKSKGTSAGDKGDKTLPSYSNWLFERMKIELSRCTDMVHLIDW